MVNILLIRVMTLTQAELNENYQMWVLLWIIQNSTPQITNFLQTTYLFSFAPDIDGNFQIINWLVESPSIPPSNFDMMSLFSPTDYIPVQKAYSLQVTPTNMPSVTNSDMSIISIDSDGISNYTMLFNTDTSQIIFKIGISWIPIITVTPIKIEGKISIGSGKKILSEPRGHSSSVTVSRTHSASEIDDKSKVIEEISTDGSKSVHKISFDGELEDDLVLISTPK